MDKKNEFIQDFSDEKISLVGRTPILISIAEDETREPLIVPYPTIYEYISNNLQVIIIISLIILTAIFAINLYFSNGEILNNILGCSNTQLSASTRN